jgi:hypothetical protein
MTTPPCANAQDISFLKAKLYTPYLGLPAPAETEFFIQKGGD